MDPKEYQTTRFKKDSLVPQSPVDGSEVVNPNDITKSPKEVGFGEPDCLFDNSPESNS